MNRLCVSMLAIAFIVSTAQAQTPPNVQTLIVQAERANSACSDRAAQCDERDALFARLQSVGWCYGLPDQSMSERRWLRCDVQAGQPDNLEAIGSSTREARVCIRLNIAAAYSSGARGLTQLRDFFKPRCYARLASDLGIAGLSDLAPASFDVLLTQELADPAQ